MTPAKKNLFIILGTSKGLGKAIQNHILKYDDNELIAVNRRKTKVKKDNFIELIMDLSKPVSTIKLNSLFNTVENKKYKNIYLINNASVIDPVGPVGEITGDDFVKATNVNFLNYTVIINEFIKITKNLKVTKKVLNVTSGAAESPHYGIGMYCATKSALEMFSQCIFLEQQKLKQIKILAFRPGVIDTGMQKRMRESKKDKFLKTDVYKKLYEKDKLIDPTVVAKKIYDILNNNKYWQKSIINISQIIN